MGHRKLCWLKPSSFGSLCDRAMNFVWCIIADGKPTAVPPVAA